MRRTWCPWFRRALAVACVLVNAPMGAPADEPAHPPPDATRSAVAGTDAAINIFLSDPAGLNAIWNSLSRPDYVILRGEDHAKLQARAAASGESAAASWASAVGSLYVEGTVKEDLADLAVELGITLAVDGPVWTTIRLDGMTLTAVREGKHDLPLRNAEGGAWQVELAGRGKHTLRARLLVPIRSKPEGRGFDLAIPEAASTRLSVVVPGIVTEAAAGPGEPVGREPIRETGATRLTAELTPRARVGLAWRVDEETAAQAAPILAAQGAIAIDVDAGSIRTRSSWSIRSIRGTARSLQFQLDPDDELLEVELDGQKLPTSGERVVNTGRMTFPLSEPLSPGRERRLVMSTRRATSTTASAARIAFSGFPLQNAREQAGAIGIAPTGNLWVTGIAGRGVRQVDPRTGLPADLRARPATELAYQFSEQPFDLTLRVEPSPPLVRAGDRTTVVLEPRMARIETWLDFETTRGRVYDLALGLPPGLEVESVGPPDVVGALHTEALNLPMMPAPGGLRLMTVRLAAKAQEAGRFSLHLIGRQAIDPSTKESAIGLFQPINATSAGGRVVVLTDPSLTAELAEENALAKSFRPALLSPPADWPWPSNRAPVTPPMLWLRHDDSPVVLPLGLTSHGRTLSQATNLRVNIDRREADFQQETELSAQFGSFDHLDVSVPASLTGRWEVEGASVVDEQKMGARGDHLVRLKLAPELVRTGRLRFRYRFAVDPRLSPETPVDLDLPWFRVENEAMTSAPTRATVVVESGLVVEAPGGSWAEGSDSTAPVGDEEGVALRLVIGDDLGSKPAMRSPVLALRISASRMADLPRLVAPRLALRTIQGPDGELRTTAWYWVEQHESSLSFALPEGADLHQVRIGGEAVWKVQEIAQKLGRQGSLRIAFPARIGNGPALLELSYVVPASRASAAWAPPRLLDGGLVQQTRWEVHVPWSRAVVGLPAGWNDENEWYWDTYLWKRRPRKSPSASLAEWVGGSLARSRGSSEVASEPESGSEGHTYRFGRVGEPVDLAVFVAARSWLVASCSGAVLAIGGLIILVWKPTLRLAWIVLATLVLSVATLLEPSATILVVQSSMIGVLLTALLALMQRRFGRQRAGAPLFGEPGSRTSALAQGGSSMARVVSVGSDDSTAIRARSVSTLDHVPTAPPPSDDTGSTGRGTRSERAGISGVGP